MCQIEEEKQLKYTHNLGVLRLKHKCDDNYNNDGRTARVMTYFGERLGSSTKRVQYTQSKHTNYELYVFSTVASVQVHIWLLLLKRDGDSKGKLHSYAGNV